ncbi:aprataxin and PNK-like factor isoform X2 [Perognathus longimembris pacificus]|uniref:aprataxin and PNK-like factor isoform X2 n=1 Tax=Perognathus longimembris pacificus TaxID=214514 RepID=UPI002018FE7A|nr:aprataxin and PNK-like factor isoform X2 [Perognathus longimembris pacificus]
MSGGFELQPLDGGPRVALAPGETVIGRGPLLGITDKKVSRKHAILEVVGGQLRIKPMHTNPCFYQSSETGQLLPMKRNLWYWLHPGDRFSLLGDKYTFLVFTTHSETDLECTLINSQKFDEDDMLNEIPKSPVINLPEKTTGTSQLERSPEITKSQTSTINSLPFLGECRTNPAQRKRILPAWMLAENMSDQDLLAPVVSGDNHIIQEDGKEGICKENTLLDMTQKGRKQLISSGNSESISAEQNSGKKYKNIDQEEPVISSKEIPDSFSPITLNNINMSSIKTNAQRHKIVVEHKVVTKETPNEEDKAASCSKSCLSVQSKLFPTESDRCHLDSGSDPSSPQTFHTKTMDSLPQGSQGNKVMRTSCMYGANCYRILSISNTSATLATMTMEMYKWWMKKKLMAGLNAPMEPLATGRIPSTRLSIDIVQFQRETF